MIRTTTAAAVASALLFAHTADAQTVHNARNTNCRDAAGTPVVAVNTTRLNNVGMAGRVRGRPVMLFNPVILQRFRPATRTFWFYHECAHHVLGHSLGHRPASRERDADCWAIRHMKARGLLTPARLRTIQRDLYPLNGDGYLYLRGPQRAAYVGYCANGRRAPAQMVQRRFEYRPAAPRVGAYRPGYRQRYGQEAPMRRDRYDDRYQSHESEIPMARDRLRRDYSGPGGGIR